MLQEQSETEESEVEYFGTVLPDKASGVSNEPLPALDVSSETEDEGYDRGDSIQASGDGAMFGAESMRAQWKW
jgi:hypothetical protein